MNIAELAARKISIPFTEPIKWGYSIREECTCAIVEVVTDDGITGFGESVTGDPEFIENVIKPQLVGENILEMERLRRKVLRFYPWQPRMHNGSWCAVELALWDIFGKKYDLPIYSLLGGLYRKRIPISQYVYIKDPEEMAKDALRYVNMGFRSLTIKLGMSKELDIRQIKEIRKAVGDEINLRANVNSIWTYLTALEVTRAIAKYNVEYIIQPLFVGDMDGIRKLVRKAAVPIAVHDDSWTKEDTYRHLKYDECDVITLDVNMAGGLMEAKKLSAICEAANRPLTIGFMGELGLTNAATTSLVASTPHINSYCDSHYLYLSDDILKGGRIQVEDGDYLVSKSPGLGVEVDERKLDKYSEYFERNVRGKKEVPISPLNDDEIVTYSRY